MHLRSWFFQITNHGVPLDLRQGMEKVARERERGEMRRERRDGWSGLKKRGEMAGVGCKHGVHIDDEKIVLFV